MDDRVVIDNPYPDLGLFFTFGFEMEKIFVIYITSREQGVDACLL